MIRKSLLVILAVLWTGAADLFAQDSGAKIDPSLRGFVQRESSEVVPVVVLMEWQRSAAVPQAYHTPEVLAYLRWQASEGWRRVHDHLQSNFADNRRHIQADKLFFLNNSFSARVTKEGLRRISLAPGVTKIYLNYEMNWDEPFPSPDYTPDLGQMPYNFRLTGLDRLIQEMPGVDGRGVIIGAIDSGVDGRHPDLAGRALFMYDARLDSLAPPRDVFYHGTHVSGILAGGNRSTRLMGVAPGATLVMASSVTLEEHLASMHYMLDTDGNPATSYDIPVAVNNSWTSAMMSHQPFVFKNNLCQPTSMPDQEPFYRAISAWEALGIVPVFSAGNCGSAERTITPPKEHPASLTVGSVGPDGFVAPDSSRGPATYLGRNVFKPEIVAPGLHILSTIPGGRHQKLSGTSMAAPQVTGTIALMAQVHPRLTPADIKDILIRTATPRSRQGGPGEYGQWTPEYGYGVLNTYEAVKRAASLSAQGQGWVDRMLSLSSVLPRPEARSLRLHGSLWEALSFPEELEGSNWLTPEDLF